MTLAASREPDQVTLCKGFWGLDVTWSDLISAESDQVTFRPHICGLVSVGRALLLRLVGAEWLEPDQVTFFGRIGPSLSLGRIWTGKNPTK